MNKNVLFIFFLAFALLAVCVPDVFASTATDNLPFEKPLEKLVTSLTGPVAFFVSLGGIFVAGAILLFGGDIQGFARTLIQVVLVIAVLVNASTIMSKVFNKSALVPVPAIEQAMTK